MSLLKIKLAIGQFYEILWSEYDCTTSELCCKFITKGLRYSKRGIGGDVPKKHLCKILSRCGLEFLGSGATRMVLGFGDFAIKVEKCEGDGINSPMELGKSSNADELWAYSEIRKSSLSKLLIIPILSHFKVRGKLVLIFPRLESYEGVFSSGVVMTMGSYNRVRERLCNLIFHDSGSSNFGVYKGEVFYLDYNIESGDHPLSNSNSLDKAINEFKIHKLEMNRTKEYLREMRSLPDINNNSKGI